MLQCSCFTWCFLHSSLFEVAKALNWHIISIVILVPKQLQFPRKSCSPPASLNDHCSLRSTMHHAPMHHAPCLSWRSWCRKGRYCHASSAQVSDRPSFAVSTLRRDIKVQQDWKSCVMAKTSTYIVWKIGNKELPEKNEIKRTYKLNSKSNEQPYDYEFLSSAWAAMSNGVVPNMNSCRGGTIKGSC